jgi:hypothetical protein
MLDLKSPTWSELRHAYGDASDIPAMLLELESFPPNEGHEPPPYFMLWSSLCHQGDVYTASYAAVPHIIRALALDPGRADLDYFLLPARIEIARAAGSGPPVPDSLEEAYFSALSRIPYLAAQASTTVWSEPHCRTIAAAIAVAKGHPVLGEAIFELEPDMVARVMELRFI